MNSGHEMMHPLGAFDPADLKRVMTALERAEVPFDVDAESAASPRGWLKRCFGMYAPGTKIVLQVPESELPRAEAALAGCSLV